MALFVTKEGKRKSPIVMMCFLLSLVFAGVFGAAYALLVGPMYRHLYFGSDLISTTVHCILIALIGTAVCCVFFLLRDKRMVPYSFVGLAVLVLTFYVAAFQLEPAARATMLYVVSLYGLAPVLLGNAVSWSIYLKIRKPAPQAD